MAEGDEKGMDTMTRCTYCEKKDLPFDAITLIQRFGIEAKFCSYLCLSRYARDMASEEDFYD